MKLDVAGENALILYVGNDASPEVSAQVQQAARAVKQALGQDLVDMVPSYASLLILFDPLATDYFSVRHRVLNAVAAVDEATEQEGSTITLPVWYSSESGADLEALAERASLSVNEVIALHSGTQYRVYAIGFAPGFAYLGQVDERIAAPRLATPRQRVPRGAVAIADRQTAVYPAVSPGGWNLVGLCPTHMFNPGHTPIMPVEVGDAVRFEPITRDEFIALGGELP